MLGYRFLLEAEKYRAVLGRAEYVAMADGFKEVLFCGISGVVYLAGP